MGINKNECATFVVELIKINANKTNRQGEALSAGVAEPFIDGYRYFTEEDHGPKLVNNEAIDQLIKILRISPLGVANFEKVYSYSTKEMKLERNEAILLATKIALETSQKVKVEKKL